MLGVSRAVYFPHMAAANDTRHDEAIRNFRVRLVELEERHRARVAALVEEIRQRRLEELRSSIVKAS